MVILSKPGELYVPATLRAGTARVQGPAALGSDLARGGAGAAARVPSA
jgi:hypothetical protein